MCKVVMLTVHPTCYKTVCNCLEYRLCNVRCCLASKKSIEKNQFFGICSRHKIQKQSEMLPDRTFAQWCELFAHYGYHIPAKTYLKKVFNSNMSSSCSFESAVISKRIVEKSLIDSSKRSYSRSFNYVFIV